MHTSSAEAAEDASPLPAVCRLRFRFRAIEPIRLPAYTGSAWRGLLGHALRQTVCVTRQPRCDGCLLLSTCVYSTFFESPAGSAEVGGRYSALPHPFVLEPEIGCERVVEPNGAMTLGVNLIGPSMDVVPYLIHSFHRAGERGLGRDKGRFALQELEQEVGLGSNRWQSIYSDLDGKLKHLAAEPAVAPTLPTNRPLSLRLRFQTPLRLKHHGRFIGPRHLTADDMLRSLLTRLAVLCQLYGQRGGFDKGPLFTAIADVELVNKGLRWHEWTRYSSRQRTTMQMGGLVGEIELRGDGLEAFWPLLHLGQWLHVGKGTSFGLGGYRLVQ